MDNKFNADIFKDFVSPPVNTDENKSKKIDLKSVSKNLQDIKFELEEYELVEDLFDTEVDNLDDELKNELKDTFCNVKNNLESFFGKYIPVEKHEEAISAIYRGIFTDDLNKVLDKNSCKVM